MDIKDGIKRAHEFSDNFRVVDGSKFRLKDFDPSDTLHLDSQDKPAAKQWLSQGVEVLADLQQRLYAQNRWSVLLVFQAMDAAGKDGTIRHVMSGVNPQGCQVYSFKVPSAEELDHDYMWRYKRCLPERGRIGVFNRSYYEEVLVVRVHPELLERQRIPPALVGKDIWDERFQDIRRWEKYLARNGTLVLKFFLHMSKGEQKKRFMERLDNPEKNWKFAASDVSERAHWDEYQKCYEEAIAATASEQAPWYVVPADNKWFTRLAVIAAVVGSIAELGLEYPRVSNEQKKDLEDARRRLEAEA